MHRNRHRLSQPQIRLNKRRSHQNQKRQRQALMMRDFLQETRRQKERLDAALGFPPLNRSEMRWTPNDPQPIAGQVLRQPERQAEGHDESSGGATVDFKEMLSPDQLYQKNRAQLRKIRGSDQ